MYKYYRAMDGFELHDLKKGIVKNQPQYWTDGPGFASMYLNSQRKVVCLETPEPLPAVKGIAEGVDDNGNINNHPEFVMSPQVFKEWLDEVGQDLKWSF